MEPKELFDGVKKLARQGLSVKEISTQLGFKTPFTFQSKLIEASQILNRPVPIYKKSKGGTGAKVIEQVEAKARGKKGGYGFSLNQDVLSRAGIKAGAILKIKTLKGRVILTAQ